MKSTTGGLAMPRNYTKVEHLSAEILRRKHAGETNRQIAESYHLTVEQVKNLVTRQNRKMRLVERGYTLRRKGRPARKDADELTTLRNECINCVCVPRYCKIFYPKLEGGEAQIPRHRTLQEEISGYSSLFRFGSLSQRILCLAKAKTYN